MDTWKTGVPRFRCTSLQQQVQVLTRARQKARAVVERDPPLSLREYHDVKKVMPRQWINPPWAGAEARWTR